MHRSLTCLRAILVVSSLLPCLAARAAGPPPKQSPPKEQTAQPRATTTPPFQDPNGDGDTAAPLGGPRVPLAPRNPFTTDGGTGSKNTTTASAADGPRTTTTASASTHPTSAGPTADNRPTGSQPFVPGVTYSGASETAPPGSNQPPAALGPAPYDLGLIKKVVVGGQPITEAPLRVGNLDILVPMVEELPSMGVNVTRVDPKLIPDGGQGPTEEQFFQINVPGSEPIVCTVGKANALIASEDTPLRCAPLIIQGKIWLPAFSVASLVGAAARLGDDGTLYINPTVESVELFPVKDMLALTIKTSSPVSQDALKIDTLPKPDRLFFDFSGYSMGFDAGNSTFERAVAVGQGDITRARAGMPQKFPDVTRITLDLKRPVLAIRQEMPNPNIIAFLLVKPGNASEIPTGPPIAGTDVFQPTLQGSLRGMTIVVDAGHGGHDTGARGAKSDEKNHTLDISLRLAKNLRDKGANVLMTRDSDIFISLDGRTSFANTRNADLFIAIHINASVNRGTQGTETYYWTAISQPLAQEIHKEFLQATGRPNRGVRTARFYVIRKTKMPSVLLECAFITNSTEEAKLMDPNWRENVARGITRGVLNYAAKYRGGVSG